MPYFIVHREDIKLDGKTPTLLYGYGGFQVSMTPGYSPVMGRNWLEQSGAYVLANIRGGGEFGPNWHQAGLKLNRQRIYDDFIAVGEDLIAKKITSPEHLGIQGGSNGGLLMGVMLNQRPDLWNAVIVQVPLLDMLRYHLLLAGASWVGEYGSPDVPEERAFLETVSPLPELRCLEALSRALLRDLHEGRPGASGPCPQDGETLRGSGPAVLLLREHGRRPRGGSRPDGQGQTLGAGVHLSGAAAVSGGEGIGTGARSGGVFWP